MEDYSIVTYIKRKFNGITLITLIITLLLSTAFLYSVYKENYIQEKIKLEGVLNNLVLVLEKTLYETQDHYNKELEKELLRFYNEYTKFSDNTNMEKYLLNIGKNIENLDDFKVTKTNYYLLNKKGTIIKTNYEDDLYLNLRKYPSIWDKIDMLEKGEVLLLPFDNETNNDKVRLYGYIKLPNDNIFEIGLNFKKFTKKITDKFTYLKKGNYTEFDLLTYDFNSLLTGESKVTDKEKKYFNDSLHKNKVISKRKSLFTESFYKGWESKYGKQFLRVKVRYKVLEKMFLVMVMIIVFIVFILLLLRNMFIDEMKKIMMPLGYIACDMDKYKQNTDNTLKFTKTKIKEINKIQNSYKNMIEIINTKNNKLKDSYDELEESYQEVNTIAKGLEKVISLTSDVGKFKLKDENEFLSNMLRTAINIIPEADFGTVYTYEKDEITFIDAVGHNISALNKLDLGIDEFKLKKDEIKIIDNIDEKLFKRVSVDKNTFNKAIKPTKQTLMFALFKNEEKSCGMNIDIDKFSIKEFENDSIKLIKDFKNLNMVFYKLQTYYKMQNDFHREIIVSMINMLEIHDSYTKNHSKNVADLSAKIAEKMGLSKERVDKAYWAGIIHDIGKTLIPYEILNNKEKLTDEEYNIIKKHPVYGYETLRDSKELRNVARYVKHHHERWDGIGYPDGLKKEEIPLISQILTVADTWDAMTSNRSYRKALSKEIAVEEIKKNKGTQFSPRVVDVFLNKLDIV